MHPCTLGQRVAVSGHVALQPCVLRGARRADVRGLSCAQLLCKEMAGAFEARAMTLPPWRQARAMLSKWLPAKVGTMLSRVCSSPAAASGAETASCRGDPAVIGPGMPNTS